DPNFAAETKKIGVTGICGSGIVEVLAEMYLAGILLTDGTIDGSLTARTSRVYADGRTFSYHLHDGEPGIHITQTDVRAIQLAKAALYAGARLLMDRLGIESVDRIVLAGAFGSHIDVKHAMILGMIPDCDLSKVGAAGNAAGSGALIALLDQKARDSIEAVVRRVEKIETAVEPRFQEHFIGAMGIPHKSTPFPNLSAAVTLPQPTSKESSTVGKRRRRVRT
ncbi:MAG: ASKHA domain-containing protein, partial [Alphaproteobacteria bacterium]